jgi:hypothetical protein
MSTFSDLPDELWVNVFEQLGLVCSNSQIGILRLVCKRFCHLTRFLKFGLKLNNKVLTDFPEEMHSKFNRIVKLVINDLQFDFKVKRIPADMQLLSNLKSLSFERIRFSDDIFVQALRRLSRNLVELRVTNCSVSSQSIKDLSSYIQTSGKDLVDLEFSFNWIGNMNHLILTPDSLPKLQTLNLSGNWLGNDLNKSFLSNIFSLPKLRLVDFCHNSINIDSFNEILNIFALQQRSNKYKEFTMLFYGNFIPLYSFLRKLTEMKSLFPNLRLLTSVL